MDAWWRRTKLRKQTRGHQTSGKEKVDTCQASALDRYFAKTSRSYKHKGFAAWSEKIKKFNRKD